MIYEYENGIPADVLREALAKSLEGRDLKKVLILPPDFTRMYSGAGKITEIYYDLLKDTCQVDIMPALGTHAPMTEEEWKAFFGSIPFDGQIRHPGQQKPHMFAGDIPIVNNGVADRLVTESRFLFAEEITPRLQRNDCRLAG